MSLCTCGVRVAAVNVVNGGLALVAKVQHGVVRVVEEMAGSAS